MPINIAKHIEYWKSGAERDIGAEQILLEKNRTYEALFYVHLTLEKSVEGARCKSDKGYPSVHA